MRSSAVRDKLVRFGLSYRGRQLAILSYDISGHDNATAVAVCLHIFGRRARVKSAGGGIKEYRYPGFIEKAGVVWLGQSVFLLRPDRFEELRRFLDAKGVAYGTLRVRIE